MVAERNKFRAINGYNKIKYSLSHFERTIATPCVACSGRYFTACQYNIEFCMREQVYITAIIYSFCSALLNCICASLRIRIKRDCKINSRENWFWCRNQPSTINIDVFEAGQMIKAFKMCGSSCASDDHWAAHSDCVYIIALRS